MFKIYHDQNINKIIIDTDEVTIKNLLEYKRTVTKYSGWKRCWETTEQIDKLYDNTRSYKKSWGYHFELGMGWCPLILSLFKDKLSPDDYNGIMGLILAPYPRTVNFNGLRDYQNSDILFMLKYRRGLLQVTVGYGKTQCICTLIRYFHDELGKNVLVVTPGSKSRDEIRKRYKSLYGEDLSIKLGDSVCCAMTSGLMNRNCMKDPELRRLEEEKLKKVNIILSDETEMTVGNDAGRWIYDNATNAELCYGFSGTASKKDGQMLTFARGITDTVMENKEILRIFGPALVYRLPTNIEVDDITIYTSALDNIEFTDEDFNQDDNVYLSVLTKIWTDPSMCRLVVKIIKKYPKIFIGINNLNTVINEWISNYFIPNKIRTLLICFDGYIYIDENGNSTNLTLEEAGEYVKNNMCDVIPSTASGFRGLDFPSLQNVLLVAGNIASSICQQAGRAARGNHMRIISITSKSGKRIPCYTKGLNIRYDLISSYFKYCNINKIFEDENKL